MRARRGPSLALAMLLALAAGSCAPPRPTSPPPAPYLWRLPPGFPRPRVPADNPMNPAKVELGRRLFHDRRLSRTGSLACAGCHRPELAFTDGRARAVGATGEMHLRGAPSLANVAYLPALTAADPRVGSLEAQAAIPLLGTHPVEQGLGGRAAAAVARLAGDSAIRLLYEAAFPAARDPLDLVHVIRALAAFERTLISGDSPYDRLVYRGERDALSAAAKRGMRLFFSPQLACARCHSGFTFGGPASYLGAAPQTRAEYHNTGLAGLPGAPILDPGLAAVTGRSEDTGRFRTPTLRNIAVTAPYLHDGSAATLGEVVDLYAAGGRRGPASGDGRGSLYPSPLVRGFPLSATAREDLLAFLESLSDPGFLTDPAFAAPAPGASSTPEVESPP